jgi:hypothetical protein
MLSTYLRRVVTVSAAAALVIVGAAGPAAAGVVCDPSGCTVVADNPGNDNGGNNGGNHGGEDGGDPWIEGPDGTVALPELNNGEPAAGGPSVRQVAARAINQLPILPPQIGSVPRSDGEGLVGLPVWMWTEVNPSTWGPATATASVPGVSVTATAQVTKFQWNMGDGTPPVTCNGPGTPWRPEYADAPSPTCGHVYAKASDGRYPITATTTWRVTWAGNGESGVIMLTRSAQSSIRITELQVVTR